MHARVIDLKIVELEIPEGKQRLALELLGENRLMPFCTPTVPYPAPNFHLKEYERITYHEASGAETNYYVNVEEVKAAFDVVQGVIQLELKPYREQREEDLKTIEMFRVRSAHDSLKVRELRARIKDLEEQVESLRPQYLYKLIFGDAK